VIYNITVDYFVYILRTSKNTLYIGQTNNLKKRILEHQNKSGRGSRYVRAFDSCELVYTEKFDSRSQAMKREYQLKQLTKTKKEALIMGDLSV
jgi:putative endonuclease